MTTKVTLNDLDALEYCRRGARKFFQRHGLPWEQMLAGGVPIEQIEVIDDEMAQAACRQARKREGKVDQ